MLCTCIVWCDETAMMIEYCAKMIGAIGVETGEEKRMKIIDKYFIKICNHNFDWRCLLHGYYTYNINEGYILMEKDVSSYTIVFIIHKWELFAGG